MVFSVIYLSIIASFVVVLHWQMNHCLSTANESLSFYCNKVALRVGQDDAPILGTNYDRLAELFRQVLPN